MENPFLVIPATALIIVLSGLFVVIEFSLLGARRHRLQETAENSRASRAALKSMNELTVMLAGAQLGITACTLALGAITKPAVKHYLKPLLDLVAMPGWIADGLAFALALLIVTFLHLVVGEMAPKSWAIAHPERSASVIAIPARGFVWIFRPLLVFINKIANRLVSMSGVEPVESAAVGGYDADTIRHLVEHSADVGALQPEFRTQIDRAIDLEGLQVSELLGDESEPTAVGASAQAKDIRAASASSGHMRILVRGEGDETPSVVHVRDTLLQPDDCPAADLARAAFTLPSDTPVHEALTRLRTASEQLAAVMEGDRFVGVITIADILRRVLPDSSAEAEIPA